MKLSKVTKIIMSRIQRIKPELDPQIIEYLMLKDYGDQEMIRLAFGVDLALQPLINEAKAALSSSFSVPINAPPISPPQLCILPTHQASPFSPIQQSLLQLLLTRTTYCTRITKSFTQFGYDSWSSSMGGQLWLLWRRSTSLPKLFPKACHYYPKGYCKHGVNCCYLHDQLTLGLTPPNSSELGGQDQVVPSGSLEKLELELVDLLKSKRGHLISITILPTTYIERYGDAAGIWPHGQHSIMLVEDALKYLQLGSAKNEMGSNVFGSQHIYFTFPSNSSLDEDDCVIDLRISTQHQHMFDFNPHYICGSHVRVKPQREVLNW
ncbi:unnamed protein product [Spirodela intermedia]|uniref:C3H1-type domain-containing protein n=1 Tax=Spirodela intermedia TaxID=51605 RepID=A0A7I8LLC1_SPIIN|nr:unnamed protein product [Spirodela intermedia]